MPVVEMLQNDPILSALGRSMLIVTAVRVPAAKARHRRAGQGSLSKRNADSMGAMKYAIQTGNADAVVSLIREGFDVNLSDYDGRTCLHIAASVGDLKLVEMFVKQFDANVAIRDRFAPNPLRFCDNCSRGTKKLCQEARACTGRHWHWLTSGRALQAWTAATRRRDGPKPLELRQLPRPEHWFSGPGRQEVCAPGLLWSRRWGHWTCCSQLAERGCRIAVAV